MVKKRRTPRIKPLLDLHCTWDTAQSTYPESINVAMQDGTIVRYVMATPDTAPKVGTAGWNVDGQVIGYQPNTKRPPEMMGSPLRRMLANMHQQ